MLTGKRPFRQTENVNVMVLHVNEAPLTLSAVRPDLTFPDEVEAVIARSLAKQPSDRQTTIQDFLLEIEQCWQNFTPAEPDLKSTISSSPFARLQEAVQINPSIYKNVFETSVAIKAQMPAASPASVLSVPEGQELELAVSAKTAVAVEPPPHPLTDIPKNEPNSVEEQISNKQTSTSRNSTVERLIQQLKKVKIIRLPLRISQLRQMTQPKI